MWVRVGMRRGVNSRLIVASPFKGESCMRLWLDEQSDTTRRLI